jgi:hypothetical protein
MAKAHYVDNKSFYAAMLEYKAKRVEAETNGLPPPRIPEYIGLCVYQIANKLATKGNFINYTFRDEMISDGIENCILYLNNFDPDRSNNPFAYFTRIIYNAFVLRIQKEKKQTYVKYKTFENSILAATSDEVFDMENAISNEIQFNDNMTSFVRDYENKIKEKKAPKKLGVERFIDGDNDDSDSTNNRHSLGL